MVLPTSKEKTDSIILNDMAQGLTLEQLKAKGAKPVQKTGGLTLQELQAKKSPVAPQQPLGERVKSGLGNFLGGELYGFSSAGRTIQNTLSKGVDKLLGTKGFGQATKEGFEASTGTDLDSTAGKVGNVLGEVAPYLMPAGGATKAPFALKTGLNFAKDTAIATAQTGDIKEGAITGALGQGIGVLGKALKPLGSGSYKSLAIPLSKNEARMVQAYKANTPFLQRVAAVLGGESKAPRIAQDTAFDKGLFGTEGMIGVQAKRATKTLWDKMISPALKAGGDVKLPALFDDAKATIIKANPELNQQKALLNALESIADDYKGTPKATLELLQDLKAGWAKPVPQKAWRGEDITGAVNNVRKTLADMARTRILTTVKDPMVKQAYIDYGNLTNLAEWGQKAMTGGKFKGGAGSWITAAKDAVVTPVATIGGQVLYLTGQGIEFIAPAGAKTLMDIIGASTQSEEVQ